MYRCTVHPEGKSFFSLDIPMVMRLLCLMIIHTKEFSTLIKFFFSPLCCPSSLLFCFVKAYFVARHVYEFQQSAAINQMKNADIVVAC
jgi:hypothetical protein